jgi:hypothetical protein
MHPVITARSHGSDGSHITCVRRRTPRQAPPRPRRSTRDDVPRARPHHVHSPAPRRSAGQAASQIVGTVTVLASANPRPWAAEPTCGNPGRRSAFPGAATRAAAQRGCGLVSHSWPQAVHVQASAGWLTSGSSVPVHPVHAMPGEVAPHCGHTGIARRSSSGSDTRATASRPHRPRRDAHPLMQSHTTSL